MNIIYFFCSSVILSILFYYIIKYKTKTIEYRDELVFRNRLKNIDKFPEWKPCMDHICYYLKVTKYWGKDCKYEDLIIYSINEEEEEEYY